MTYSAKSIANCFIDFARAYGSELSPMKLQKLVYYAHGWYLGYTKMPLINEPVEAWQYGPVIPSLYHEFKSFGSKSVTNSKACDFDFGDMEWEEVSPPDDPKIVAFLESVWKSYSKYSAIRLSEMTHASNSPWDITWSQAKGLKGVDIPNELILNHFESAIRESKQSAAAST